MISRRSVLAIATVLALPVAVLCGQEPAFKASIGWVVLHATVKDRRGNIVTTLERGAFSVYENGKRQPITLFSNEDVPVSLGLLLDNSGSMRRVRPSVEAAAQALARESNPQDEYFVVNFADKPRLDVPLTTDLGEVQAGIARLDSIGGTAVRDAVDMAESYMRDHATRDRKVLVLITDGRDNASMVTLDQIVRTAGQNQVAIYAIGLWADTDTPQSNRDRHQLEQLIKPTGGTSCYPREMEEIDSMARALARELRNQYTIAYAPVNQTLDGSYRTIRVQTRGNEPLTVATRTGYWATAQ